MKKYISNIKFLSIALAATLAFSSCTQEEEPLPAEGSLASSTGTVTDLEGNVYKTVTVGNQTWMAENLRSTVFQPIVASPIAADTLTLASGASLWNSAAGTYYVPYLNNATNRTNFGLLYNGLVVISNRNICPDGWKIPSEEDFITLRDFLDGERSFDGTNSAGGKLKSINTEFWDQPNVDATNETGFNALPSGARLTNTVVANNAFAQYTGLGTVASYWIKKPVSNQDPFLLKASLTSSTGSLSISPEPRSVGLAIRCIKE